MDNLEHLLRKVEADNLKKKEEIIKEGEKKIKDIISSLEEQAYRYFQEWFEKEKEKLFRMKQEKMFEAKLEFKKAVLTEKESIINEALRRIEEFLRKNTHLIPNKEVVTPSGIKEEALSLEEFLKMLKDDCFQEIEKVWQQ